MVIKLKIIKILIRGNLKFWTFDFPDTIHLISNTAEILLINKQVYTCKTKSRLKQHHFLENDSLPAPSRFYRYTGEKIAQVISSRYLSQAVFHLM